MGLPTITAYTDILREEIVPAIGCTEPISIAFCAAKAHQVLGMQPTAVTVTASADVLKNVKSVVVPNTNGLTGIRAAIAAGIVFGDAEKGVQVIGSATDEQRAAVKRFLETVHFDVSCVETECPMFISVTLYARTSYSRVAVAENCANIIEIMKNGEALFSRPIVIKSEEDLTDKRCLNLHDILEYADQIDLNSICDLLEVQLSYNTAICEEGLKNDYGANIGKILHSENATDLITTAKAYAAAGGDAKTGGCELPVATLCGSGSLGIAAVIPIIRYARYFSIPTERIYRALIVSDLLTVFLKNSSDYAPAVCSTVYAGCAVGAAVAYLLGGDEAAVSETLENAKAISTGMTCDGAKPSCAAKIASSIETGLLGYQMYLHK